jgi:pyruvate,orthophosphate dikinase
MINVYPFTGEYMDKAEMGNKGNNLVAMTRLGLQVPPGFVIAVKAFKLWQETGMIPEDDILKALSLLELKIGKKLGAELEVSVRSSAAASMPGMMDTILNIGDHSTVLNAIRRIFESWNNPRANDYRRLNNIPISMGTAAIVQVMVFGNRDQHSGTGVIFSRDPGT